MTPNTFFKQMIGDVGEIEVSAHVPDGADYVGQVTIIGVGVEGDTMISPEDAGFNSRIISDLRKQALEEAKKPKSALPPESASQEEMDKFDSEFPW